MRAAVLEMLPLMTPRYYSISFSPMTDDARCSITVAVVEAPARAGSGVYQGVCSSHVARQAVGERAALKAQSRTLGPAMLFFGCRHPDQDYIYADELQEQPAAGVVNLQVAFSRHNGEKTSFRISSRSRRERYRH